MNFLRVRLNLNGPPRSRNKRQWKEVAFFFIKEEKYVLYDSETMWSRVQSNLTCFWTKSSLNNAFIRIKRENYKQTLKIDYKNRYKYTKLNLISKYWTWVKFRKLKNMYLTCNVFCSLWNVIYLKRHCQILFLSIRKHMLFVCVTVLYITVHRPQAKRHVTFDRTFGNVSNMTEYVKRDSPCCDGMSLGLRSGRVVWT